jgi:hypothetical protein
MSDPSQYDRPPVGDRTRPGEFPGDERAVPTVPLVSPTERQRRRRFVRKVGILSTLLTLGISSIPVGMSREPAPPAAPVIAGQTAPPAMMTSNHLHGVPFPVLTVRYTPSPGFDWHPLGLMGNAIIATGLVIMLLSAWRRRRAI